MFVLLERTGEMHLVLDAAYIWSGRLRIKELVMWAPFFIVRRVHLTKCVPFRLDTRRDFLSFIVPISSIGLIFIHQSRLHLAARRLSASQVAWRASRDVCVVWMSTCWIIWSSRRCDWWSNMRSCSCVRFWVPALQSDHMISYAYRIWILLSTNIVHSFSASSAFMPVSWGFPQKKIR